MPGGKNAKKKSAKPRLTDSARAGVFLKYVLREMYIPSRASSKEAKRPTVGDQIRMNMHRGKIENAVVRAVIQDADGTKLQVDVVGFDLTALINVFFTSRPKYDFTSQVGVY